MHTKRKEMKKHKKLTWQEVLVIVMVMILALLLIFSRGFRAARRVEWQAPDQAAIVLASMPGGCFSTVPPIKQHLHLDGNMQTHGQHHHQALQDHMRHMDLHNKHIEETRHKHKHPSDNGRLFSKHDRDMMDDASGFGDITMDMLLGRIDPESDEAGFVEISRKYANRQGMFLRREAMKALIEMHAAAEKEGLQLVVLSATRTFSHQKRIWENKWHGISLLHGDILATDIDDPVERSREILRFSAMPGTSRHHWGTDVDLNSLQNSYFEHGRGKLLYQWLKANAADFGFCQPYTAHGKKRVGGYDEERWHWSYKPLASVFYHAFAEQVSYEDIDGFDGAETARKMRVIEDYVLDVNKDCF